MKATVILRCALVLCGAAWSAAGASEDQAHAAAPLSLSVSQDVQAAPQADVERSVQSMLWARRQAVSVGFGVEQRSRRLSELATGAAAAPMVQGQRLMVGVSVATSERTSVALQAPIWRDQRERAADDAPRMQLRSRDSLGELRAGLQMKMQVSEGTTVALRPRKRGFGVTLRSQW